MVLACVQEAKESQYSRVVGTSPVAEEEGALNRRTCFEDFKNVLSRRLSQLGCLDYFACNCLHHVSSLGVRYSVCPHFHCKYRATPRLSYGIHVGLCHITRLHPSLAASTLASTPRVPSSVMIAC